MDPTGRVDVSSFIPSTEEFFTSPEYFDVGSATPLQRAICRIADGREIASLAGFETVRRALTNWTHPAPVDMRPLRGVVPREICIIAGTRGGKTRFAAACATRNALVSPMDDLLPGEIPRIPIVSLTRDLAGPAFQQISQTFLEKPLLRSLLVDEPKNGSILIRHPSGKKVEICVVAGKRAGASLVARWFPAVIFDEAPRMLGSEDGAIVNLSDMLTAIRSRMRGPVFLIGSPWAPMGPVYEKVSTYHGKPSRRLVVIRAKGSWLNPTWWTPKRVDDLRTSESPEDQIAVRTDEDCEFVEAEEGLVTTDEISAATLAVSEIPPEDDVPYVAAMDPATRGNGWVLAIRCQVGGKSRFVFVKEWRGSKAQPLDPEVVLGEMAVICKRYRIVHVFTDQWSFDSMRIIARDAGIKLVEHQTQGIDRTKLLTEYANKFRYRTIQTVNVPYIRTDLLAVKKRALPGGGFTIVLPKTADGRHCDTVPAMALCDAQHCDEVPDRTVGPPTFAQEVERSQRENLQKALARYGDKKKRRR